MYMYYNIIVIVLVVHITYIQGQTYSLSGSASYSMRGGDYRFTCQISGGNLPGAVSFNKGSNRICRVLLSGCQQSSSDTRSTCGCINGNNSTLYLNITNVNSTDAVDWTCRDIDINGGASQTVTLLVYYGPENTRFTPINSSITVIEKKSTTVTCSADCNPPCNINWYKGADSSGTIISSSNGLLQLNNIQRQDTAYTCQAEHSTLTTTPLTKTLQITVYYGPANIRFTPTSSSITVIENQSRTIICSADCNPPCNMNWYKDSTIISSTEHLSLNNFQRQQAGNYTCQVTNTQIPDSLQSKQLVVIVHYPPTITSLISDATNNMIHEDSTVTFTCSVDSLPSSVISWSRSQQGGQLYSGSHYTISKASCQHTDNYTCTASYDIGQSVSKTIPLYVRCVPVIDPSQESKTSISVGRGETGVLSIYVLAYPLPVYTWYYQLQDGSEKLVTDFRSRQEDDGLSSTLTIQDVTEDDSGKYIVYVNNSLGTRSTLFNLAVTSQDDGGQFCNDDIISRERGIGIAIGLGMCFIIFGNAAFLLWIFLKKSGKIICFRKINGDKTVVNDTVSHHTALDNINLSDTPHVYDQVNTGTIQASTTESTNPGYINTSTTSSPYEVLDKQTIDQQPSTYQQLSPYQNISGGEN